MYLYTLCLPLNVLRELWQGNRWFSDSLYYAVSLKIFNEEVYPGECLTYRHDQLGEVIGKILYFFTKVGTIL